MSGSEELPALMSIVRVEGVVAKRVGLLGRSQFDVLWSCNPRLVAEL